MKKTGWYLLLLGLAIAPLPAMAGMKFDAPGVERLASVALVGYSFYRTVELEQSGPFAMPKIKELKPADPEFRMIEEADDRVLQLLQKAGSFSVLPQEEVFASALYQSSTKDPKSKLAANWYFPGQFRVIDLKKKGAMALCEALGVDAVLQISFKHDESESSTAVSGVFGKTKSYLALKGEITMIDKAGNVLISGSVKSDSLVRSSTRTWGDEEGAGAVEINRDAPGIDDLYSKLLNDYLEKLGKALAIRGGTAAASAHRSGRTASAYDSTIEAAGLGVVDVEIADA